MAWCAVEVLNDVAEAGLVSLPKDSQARFPGISELAESFGLSALGCGTSRFLKEKLCEMHPAGREGN